MDESCVDPNTAAEFLEGLLSVEISGRVEGHMARCADCRQLIAALAQAGDAGPDAPGASDATTDRDTSDRALAPTEGRLGGPPLREQVLAEGTKVDRFIVLQRVGAGGMGIVYAAYDPHLDRKIALKFLRGEAARGSGHSADARARLIGEAQAIARITHPNVISVYDVGTYHDEVYLAMEFVAGHTLTRWLRRGRRSWRDIRDVFVLAAQGLAAAHRGDIVHRDFKPENVLVGDNGRVCVMDFGLARSAEQQEPSAPSGDDQPSALGASLTRTGAILGTPRYMAPEQSAGKTADGRSDQFSLCVALYEALYRTYPFYGETAAQLTWRLPVDDQLRPIEREREVPGWLRQTVLRGMAVDPDQRYESMPALIAALSDRVSRRMLYVAAAALVPVVALGVLSLRSMSSEEAARDRARATEQQLAAARHEAETAADQIARLRHDIGELQAKVESRAGLQQELMVLRTELATKEARLADIEETEQRRAEARRKSRPYEERLDRGLVQRRLERRRGALETCYQRGRERNPIMGEWVTTEFGIDRDGAVTWVRISGLRSREVAECMRGVIRGISFPRSHVNTIGKYAFDFEPGRSRTYLDIREGGTAGGPDPYSGGPPSDGVMCPDRTDPLCGVD